MKQITDQVEAHRTTLKLLGYFDNQPGKPVQSAFEQDQPFPRRFWERLHLLKIGAMIPISTTEPPATQQAQTHK